MVRYAATIFLSSILLFLIQPMLAKIILPWFGGTATVWSSCLIFYQSALFLGYCYAHWITRCNPKVQLLIHGTLLVAAGLSLPIVPDESFKPGGGEDPSLSIFWLLTSSIGLPFLALSATGPLIQAWQSRSDPTSSVYRLFALSNLGSLIALLGYPFLVEPLLTLQQQSSNWTILFVTFLALCILSAWRQSFFNKPDSTSANEKTAPVSASRLLAWLLLSFSASAVLMASTNQMTQEIASIPFLWVWPLTLYLITFIYCFEYARWYRWKVFCPAMVLTVFLAFFLLQELIRIPIPFQIAGFSLVVFFCCLCCHGELEKIKPPKSQLTLFYLLISAGGALGGIFVGLLAPRIFNSFVEFEISVALAVVTCILAHYLIMNEGEVPTFSWYDWTCSFLGVLAAVLICANPIVNHYKAQTYVVIKQVRNPYGVLKVRSYSKDGGEYRRTLINGNIKHGGERYDLDDPNMPTSYYSKHSGLGLAITELRKQIDSRGLKVGVIGLGTGTTAAWAEPGDEFKFYELNPQVIDIAREYFSFLDKSKSRENNSVVIGDARIQLENKLESGGENFDLLAVDAFTSDAIPIHLLTTECFQTYSQHLQENGIIAVHISNRFVDLRPIMRNAARESGYLAYLIDDGTDELGTSESTWVLLTLNSEIAEILESHPKNKKWPKRLPELVWTDDFGAIFPLLRYQNLWEALFE